MKIPLSLATRFRIQFFAYPPSISKKYLSTTTYYDSQSGLHIPIHNEKEIRLFLDINHYNRKNKEIFMPNQMYKNVDEADEMLDKLKHLVENGVHGLILPELKFPRDIRNFQTLSDIAPSGFTFICSSSETTSTNDNNHDIKGYSSSTNLSKIFRYDNSANKNNDTDATDFQGSFQKSIKNGHHTTLMITDESIYTNDSDDVDPITLANNIASMIDTKGGCDFIWISSKGSNIVTEHEIPLTNSSMGVDTITQICEELLYLDVAGATIKSRLLIDLMHEDVVEDAMFAGVNKYVIDSEEQIEIVEAVAIEQGKYLVRE